MKQQEQTQLKMTLLLIKDWDGFQVAMREVMQYAGCLQRSASRREK